MMGKRGEKCGPRRRKPFSRAGGKLFDTNIDGIYINVEETGRVRRPKSDISMVMIPAYAGCDAMTKINYDRGKEW